MTVAVSPDAPKVRATDLGFPPAKPWWEERPIICLSRWELERLPEYSTTLPTGTTAGKMWRRDVANYWDDPKAKPIWIIGQYGEAVGNQVPITWYHAIVSRTMIAADIGLYA